MTTSPFTKALMSQLIADTFNPVSGTEPNRAQVKNTLDKLLETLTNIESGIAPTSYISGRWYPCIAGNTSTAAYPATGAGTIAFMAPFYVGRRTTFTDIGMIWSSNAAATACKFAVFSSPDLKAGSLVAQVEKTGISTSISAETAVSATFASPITLEPGWYYLAGLPNAAVAVFTSQSAICAAGAVGCDTLDSNYVRRIELQGLVYATGFPASFSNIARSTSSSVWPLFFMKAQ